MAKVTFDGTNKLIIANSGTVELDVKADLYSEWKRFLTGSNNAKYKAAFRSFGNDPLGGGLNAGSFFFLQNQSGSDWRIRPQEADHELKVIGNLYTEDSTLPSFVPTLGDFTVSIVLERSSLTQKTDAETTWSYSHIGTYQSGSFGELMKNMFSRGFIR